MSNTLKTLVFGAITALLGIVLLLVMAEIILRIFWTPIVGEVNSRERGGNDVFGLGLLAGVSGVHSTGEFTYSFQNSQQGFRSSKIFSEELPEGYKRRVLLLGDSFVYGYGVHRDQTFANLLDEALPDTEIVNSGVSAYGQRNELAVLDVTGSRLSPDIVMLFFFWNDLDDNVKNKTPDYFLDKNGRIVRTDYKVPEDYNPLYLRSEPMPADRRSWGRKTYVYQFYKDGLKAIRYKYFGRTEFYLTNDTPEKLQAAWELTNQYLEMIKIRAEELGAELYIIHIPDYSVVDATKMYKHLPKDIVFVEEGFRQVCKELNAACLDLTPALISMTKKTDAPLYYENDRHLTAAGHRVVADELLKLLDGSQAKVSKAAALILPAL